MSYSLVLLGELFNCFIVSLLLRLYGELPAIIVYCKHHWLYHWCWADIIAINIERRSGHCNKYTHERGDSISRATGKAKQREVPDAAADWISRWRRRCTGLTPQTTVGNSRLEIITAWCVLPDEAVHRTACMVESRKETVNLHDCRGFAELQIGLKSIRYGRRHRSIAYRPSNTSPHPRQWE